MKTAKQPDKAAAEALKVNERKWTKALMDTGWTVLPNIILECQKTLNDINEGTECH